jgi:hypothetical protein
VSGTFNGNEFYAGNIAERIEAVIARNGERAHPYSAETLEKFKEAARVLRLGEAMAIRIDKLLDDDDSEETFHTRWDEEGLNGKGDPR